MADGIYAKLRVLNRPKYDENKAAFNVIASYVHKTLLNGILVSNEFYNIYLPGVLISEKISNRSVWLSEHWREYQLVCSVCVL